MTDTDHQPFAMIIKIKCVVTVRMITVRQNVLAHSSMSR